MILTQTTALNAHIRLRTLLSVLHGDNHALSADPTRTTAAHSVKHALPHLLGVSHATEAKNGAA